MVECLALKIVCVKSFFIFRRSHKRREMDVEYEEKKASLSLTQVRNGNEI